MLENKDYRLEVKPEGFEISCKSDEADHRFYEYLAYVNKELGYKVSGNITSLINYTYRLEGDEKGIRHLLYLTTK